MKTGIFELIAKEHISEMLDTLYKYTELPIRLIDAKGLPLLIFGEETHYCTLIQKHVFSYDTCLDLHAKAGERAWQLGEAYIFSCHAHLNHIAFPVMNDGQLLGCILIGPFLMDQPDSTLISGMIEDVFIQPALALELYDELSRIKIIETDRVTYLSKLVGYLLSSLLPAERVILMQNRERLAQQSKINETIQLYKSQNTSATQEYFYEKETALLIKVKAGNIQESKALLNELLGYALFCDGGNIETIRQRAIELTTLLSHVAVEGGAHADSIYDMNSRFLSQLSRQQDFVEISMLLQEVVEGFMSVMFNNIDKGNRHIRRALQYISTHYTQPLSLADVANAVDLSPNYFSNIFRKIVGESFHSYLMRVRVEESKQLLLSTSDSLTDIAIAMGFSDQSYYCRIFNKIIGMTPGKYRKRFL